MHSNWSVPTCALKVRPVLKNDGDAKKMSRYTEAAIKLANGLQDVSLDLLPQ